MGVEKLIFLTGVATGDLDLAGLGWPLGWPLAGRKKLKKREDNENKPKAPNPVPGGQPFVLLPRLMIEKSPPDRWEGHVWEGQISEDFCEFVFVVFLWFL